MWQAYGHAVKIAIVVNGKYYYPNGCFVEVAWSLRTRPRRSDLAIVTYKATVPNYSNAAIDTDGATASTLASSVNAVKQSDTTKYSNAATLSASSISSASATTVVIVSLTGGTEAPTSTPDDNDYSRDTMLIAVGVVGAAVIIAVVVFVVVKIGLKAAKPAPAKPAKESFASVGLQQIEPVANLAEQQI